MKSPTFAPAYASIYPGLAQICRAHGYALAIHGSVQRDFDVVAIPWVDDAGDPEDVVTEIVASFAVTRSSAVAAIRSHGRILYGLCLAGEAFVDLSFMPRLPALKPGEVVLSAEQVRCLKNLLVEEGCSCPDRPEGVHDHTCFAGRVQGAVFYPAAIRAQGEVGAA